MLVNPYSLAIDASIHTVPDRFMMFGSDANAATARPMNWGDSALERSRNFAALSRSPSLPSPAEAAGIKYDVKLRADLARVPVSKEAEIKSHTQRKIEIPKAKVNLDKAFKRHRQPRISQTMPPITPKVGKLV